MKIETLQAIGRRLLKEIPLLKKDSKVALGIGASGDKTYRIDKEAEDIILTGLDESGEPLTIISEEAGVQELRGGGKKILIDPIDGSRNAISGIPFFCTSIAVADGDRVGDIESAYVVNLISGDEFWAEKGKGAFRNHETIHTQTDDVFYLVAYEAQSPGRDIAGIIPLLSRARKTRCLGSTALDLSYLACGSISLFANPSPSRSFDFAGGWLLVREAGGIFSNWEGASIEMNELGLKKSTPLLVSGNQSIHEIALRLLARTHD